MPYNLIDLQRAERHVAEGERHIARQKEILHELAGNADLFQAAEDLMVILQATHRVQVKHRDAIAESLRGQG